MTISKIDNETLEQECVRCGGKQTVDFGDLEVGLKHGERWCDSIVKLPKCLGCGSVEYLISTPGEAHPAPGSFGHLHRILTNTLHARLVSKGRVAEGLLPQDVSAQEPEEELATWFGGDLQLARHAE